ncbi:uncharacterized protein BX664DRAFT_353371 [Halteromyces radiatus]|uniref:uncharacterized protein n=1 Tax=Halteromyces radiatus TaxID=101107 RepID=UPI00221F12F0|nr:uncharacterized protein BX664DRAFT_353371 [Halteromyces radiatus]KAI8078778.1 hypothetical protein BX664DRAFT_353371 [Halteromyces radiatus]
MIQFVLVILLGSVPRILCDLYSYTAGFCAEGLDIKVANDDCVKLTNVGSLRVAGGTEYEWFLYTSYDCSGTEGFVIYPEDGCVDEQSYGFIPHSAHALLP